MCKGTVLLYRCWKGGSCIFLVCQALLAVVAGWWVSWPSETCKCGIHNNQSSCRSLCGFFEHACLEANTGLWFLLGAGNGNLISSSCVHLQNKGCIYPLLAAFAVLNASPLPTQTSFCSPSCPSQSCLAIFCWCFAREKNLFFCCWRWTALGACHISFYLLSFLDTWEVVWHSCSLDLASAEQ